MSYSGHRLTGDVRIVLTVRGKTGEREVVCNEGVDHHLRDLFEFRQAELGHAPEMNEFIFCRRDGTSTGSFKKGFYRRQKQEDHNKVIATARMRRKFEYVDRPIVERDHE